MAAPIRVGVCSWADETLTKVWYPKGVKSGEERLRYYAERFDVVEANSTYYRLPEPQMVENWAERTPPGFTMHVKAFGVMTRHPVKVDQLPSDLRDVPTDARGRVDRPPRARSVVAQAKRGTVRAPHRGQGRQRRRRRDPTAPAPHLQRRRRGADGARRGQHSGPSHDHGLDARCGRRGASGRRGDPGQRDEQDAADRHRT